MGQFAATETKSMTRILPMGIDQTRTGTEAFFVQARQLMGPEIVRGLKVSADRNHFSVKIVDPDEGTATIKVGLESLGTRRSRATLDVSAAITSSQLRRNQSSVTEFRREIAASFRAMTSEFLRTVNQVTPSSPDQGGRSL